jgi:predicted Zn-dependent peptidase
MGTYYQYELPNGLKVIVVENHKIARLTLQLYLDLPPVLENDKAGTAYFMGELLSKGTKNRPKDKLEEEIDLMGASFFTSSTGVYLSGLSRHKAKLMEIMADVARNPTFDQIELDKLKSQTLNGIQASKEDPNSISSNLRQALVYGSKHPYGELQTEATIAAIQVDDCKSNYDRFFTPSAAYLVVVGDISLSETKKLVETGFGKWEGHNLVKLPLDKPTLPAANTVSFAHKAGAVQSVIAVTYPIELPTGSPNAIAATVLNEILGGSSFGARLMQNLREDKGFTYGCRSSISSDPYIGEFTASASVRNEVTDSAVTEILFEMKRLVDDLATEDELKRVKASIKGAFSRRLENPQTIANYALNTAMYNLPKDYYANYLKNVEAVTLADLKAAAALFLKPSNAHIIVVGDGVNVAPSLEKFGAVQFYDAFAQPVDAPGFALDEGTTALSVLEKAIAAYGGKDVLAKVKTYELHTEATTPMGNLLLKKVVVVKKKQMYQGMFGGNNLLNKTVVNGDQFYSGGAGGEQEVDEPTKARLYDEIPIHQEILLIQNTASLQLLGGEVFNGQKVVVVAVNNPIGPALKRYYSLETGYMIAQVEPTTDGKEVIWTYDEYRDFGGIKLPTKLKNNVMPFDFELQSANFNEKVSKSLFKI